ncbi:hypothetical protein LIER_35719 [Lithospermum erythrorhizon]|uniref:Uncharacterized protein n=1 Tax=Lithospermum erythrorhizon TaxID=34254 RepID=A0AAV3NV91_LITER
MLLIYLKEGCSDLGNVPYPISESIKSETDMCLLFSLLRVMGIPDQLGLEPNWADQKDPSGKYLALYRRANRQEGSVMICQTCLLNKAMLKVMRFRNPSPALDLALQSLSQLAQYIAFLFASDPHQYLARIVFVSLQHCIDKSLGFQSSTLRHSLYYRGKNDFPRNAYGGEETYVGTMRYSIRHTNDVTNGSPVYLHPHSD